MSAIKDIVIDERNADRSVLTVCPMCQTLYTIADKYYQSCSICFYDANTGTYYVPLAVEAKETCLKKI